MSSDTVRFAEDSLLDILIPEASDLDIEEALASSSPSTEADDSALITSIPQRTVLFFGMLMPIQWHRYRLLLILRDT